MAKPKTRTKKQGVVPGTERKEIPRLEDAAEAYRKTVVERMQLQRVEADQKAHLKNTIHQCIQNKEVPKVDLEKSTPTAIHRYEDEDGELRDITFCYGQEKCGTKKAELSE